MKIVRVHNPSTLTVTKRRSKKTMATRRRKRRSATVARRAAPAYKRVNPRRRRKSRRRNPTVIVAQRPSHAYRRARVNPKRRRRHARRRNPSGLRVGQIIKDMIYGAGGAIATRAVSSVAQGFVPNAFVGNPLTGPVLQAATAVIVVRWAGKKFLGQQQGDIMMLGGLISAGLEAADKFLPNIQGQITGIIRAPVSVAPALTANQVAAGQQAALAGYSDVEEVPGFSGQPGLGDVYDVDPGQFNQY